jgi:hypothetical protein
MSLVKYIQQKFIRYREQNREKKQALNSFSIDSVKKVGILFQYASPDQLIQLQNFKNFFKPETDISIFGYSQNPVTDAEFNGQFKIISKQDLSYFNFPKSSDVEFFTNTEFDLLVNFSESENFTLFYVTAVTGAAIKVGNYHSKYEHLFDVMFDLKEQNTLQNFIKYIEQYLKIISRS